MDTKDSEKSAVGLVLALCRAKERFETREEALVSLKSRTADQRIRRKVGGTFLCRVCGGWHLTGQ